VTTTEIVVNCIILSFAVGAIAGVLWANWYWLEPLRRDRDKYRQKAIRAEANSRPHLGTPYRTATKDAALAALIDMAREIPTVDDHNGSRRATHLEVVQ
jgi:hypothetical protein